MQRLICAHSLVHLECTLGKHWCKVCHYRFLLVQNNASLLALKDINFIFCFYWLWKVLMEDRMLPTPSSSVKPIITYHIKLISILAQSISLMSSTTDKGVCDSVTWRHSKGWCNDLDWKINRNKGPLVWTFLQLEWPLGVVSEWHRLWSPFPLKMISTNDL